MDKRSDRSKNERDKAKERNENEGKPAPYGQRCIKTATRKKYNKTNTGIDTNTGTHALPEQPNIQQRNQSNKLLALTLKENSENRKSQEKTLLPHSDKEISSQLMQARETSENVVKHFMKYPPSPSVDVETTFISPGVYLLTTKKEKCLDEGNESLIKIPEDGISQRTEISLDEGMRRGGMPRLFETKSPLPNLELTNNKEMFGTITKSRPEFHQTGTEYLIHSNDSLKEICSSSTSSYVQPQQSNSKCNSIPELGIPTIRGAINNAEQFLCPCNNCKTKITADSGRKIDTGDNSLFKEIPSTSFSTDSKAGFHHLDNTEKEDIIKLPLDTKCPIKQAALKNIFFRKKKTDDFGISNLKCKENKYRKDHIVNFPSTTKFCVTKGFPMDDYQQTGTNAAKQTKKKANHKPNTGHDKKETISAETNKYHHDPCEIDNLASMSPAYAATTPKAFVVKKRIPVDTYQHNASTSSVAMQTKMGLSQVTVADVNKQETGDHRHNPIESASEVLGSLVKVTQGNYVDLNESNQTNVTVETRKTKGRRRRQTAKNAVTKMLSPTENSTKDITPTSTESISLVTKEIPMDNYQQNATKCSMAIQTQIGPIQKKPAGIDKKKTVNAGTKKYPYDPRESDNLASVPTVYAPSTSKTFEVTKGIPVDNSQYNATSSMAMQTKMGSSQNTVADVDEKKTEEKKTNEKETDEKKTGDNPIECGSEVLVSLVSVTKGNNVDLNETNQTNVTVETRKTKGRRRHQTAKNAVTKMPGPAENSTKDITPTSTESISLVTKEIPMDNYQQNATKCSMAIQTQIGPIQKKPAEINKKKTVNAGTKKYPYDPRESDNLASVPTVYAPSTSKTFVVTKGISMDNSQYNATRSMAMQTKMGSRQNTVADVDEKKTGDNPIECGSEVLGSLVSLTKGNNVDLNETNQTNVTVETRKTKGRRRHQTAKNAVTKMLSPMENSTKDNTPTSTESISLVTTEIPMDNYQQNATKCSMAIQAQIGPIQKKAAEIDKKKTVNAGTKRYPHDLRESDNLASVPTVYAPSTSKTFVVTKGIPVDNSQYNATSSMAMQTKMGSSQNTVADVYEKKTDEKKTGDNPIECGSEVLGSLVSVSQGNNVDLVEANQTNTIKTRKTNGRKKRASAKKAVTKKPSPGGGTKGNTPTSVESVSLGTSRQRGKPVKHRGPSLVSDRWHFEIQASFYHPSATNFSMGIQTQRGSTQQTVPEVDKKEIANAGTKATNKYQNDPCENDNLASVSTVYAPSTDDPIRDQKKQDDKPLNFKKKLIDRYNMLS